MNKTSQKPPRPGKATPVKEATKLRTSLGALNLSTSTDQDAIVESVSPTRKSKVWNEPVYLKKRPKTSPLKLQSKHDYLPPPVLEETKTPLFSEEHVQENKGLLNQ